MHSDWITNPLLPAPGVMTLIMGAGVLSFGFSFLLTPLCRNLAGRLHIMDVPDYRRKVHARPIARIGGVPILLSISLAIGICAFLERRSNPSLIDWADVLRCVPAMAVIFLVGLLDDICGLKPWQKLAGQLAGASLACLAGVQIHSVGGAFIGHTWWNVPLTIVWLIGCTNAFNLIDGVDGLAAGVGFFAAATTFISALLSANFGLAMVTAPLVTGLLGFLRYNFNPATIFLGDCGSLSIGFLLGACSVIWSQKSATLLGMTAPLIAMSIPLSDTLIAIIRRFLCGRPIFAADRSHIHHRLLALGLTPRRVALLLYAVAGVAAACSLLVSVSSERSAGLVLVLFCIGAWIGIQHLGYGEFHAARHVLFEGVVTRVINAQVALQQMETALTAADSDEDAWTIVTETSRTLGFCDATVTLGSLIRTERFKPARPSECWQLLVPLNGRGQARFSVPYDQEPRPVKLALFATLVRRHLGGVRRRAGARKIREFDGPLLDHTLQASQGD